MVHYGKIIYNMAQLTGKPLKQIANEAGYTEQGFYRVVKKKNLNTRVIELFAKACQRQVKIEVK